MFCYKEFKESKNVDSTAKAKLWSEILSLKPNGELFPWTVGVNKQYQQTRLKHPKAQYSLHSNSYLDTGTTHYREGEITQPRASFVPLLSLVLANLNIQKIGCHKIKLRFQKVFLVLSLGRTIGHHITFGRTDRKEESALSLFLIHTWQRFCCWEICAWSERKNSEKMETNPLDCQGRLNS